jgi:hypothetical protein
VGLAGIMEWALCDGLREKSVNAKIGVVNMSAFPGHRGLLISPSSLVGLLLDRDAVEAWCLGTGSRAWYYAGR